MSVPERYLERLPYYFSHLTQNELDSLLLPQYAAYSVSAFDDAFSNAYWLSTVFPHICRIIDLTACAGVDTTSFGFFFSSVTSYEINPEAFASLQRHVEICRFKFDEQCVYELINRSGTSESASDDTIFVIDPEWGGPEYKKRSILRLKYGDEYCDDFIKSLLLKSQRSAAFLKLPNNYDIQYIRNTFQGFEVDVQRVKNQVFVTIAKESFYANSEFFDIALREKGRLQTIISGIEANVGNRIGLTQAFHQRDWVYEISDIEEHLAQYKEFDEKGFSRGVRGKFGVVTGFMILDTKYGPSCETDGPIGAARLIISLLVNYNCDVTCFTEIGCEEVIKALFAFVDQKFEFLQLSTRVQVKTRNCSDLEECFKSQQMLFFVEKVGSNVDGHPLSMRAVDCSEHVTPLYENFECPSVGIGDGGNEIGCGGLKFPGAERIHCVVKTSFTLLADVSNYGASLLARTLSTRELSLYIQRGLEEMEMLDVCCNAGAVDGVSAERCPTVDGLDPEKYCATISNIFK